MLNIDPRFRLVHIHPEYHPSRTYNDIAIVELQQAVSYTEFVYPICLHANITDPIGLAYVTGWGLTNSLTKTRSSVLLSTKLDIVPLQKCREAFVGYDLRGIREGIQETQICAHDSQLMKDSCKGDSGGPLFLALDLTIKYYSLIGIVSAGEDCGSSTPGIYTRVASYMDYIESIVWPNGFK
ncbi:serine protease persephone-like [Musca vetustissima]|uniref:serine protease persephone-like n=1 Tax=Musca vetustissima TaxID=27455 RepID=UPI002AB62ED8|nr:serine protease persephone-like [Musca vetustissima]